jgi:aspartyl-tRNA(Asn)/glutamyl-tRNA(Gln) amidotransferase subunit B
VQSGKITGTAAKDILTVLFRKGGDPEKVVEEQGLTQISAADELSDVIEQVIDGNPKPVADYHGGKEEALKFLVGQVMRQTRGRAKPDLVHELLRERLTKS